MAVHYFGFPSDIRRFRTLCDRYNLLLIEDCAHVLEGVVSQHRFGEIGDFSVFSPRKFLPIFDGGRLRLNRNARDFYPRLAFEGPLFTLRVAKNLIDDWRRPVPPLSAQLNHLSHAEESEGAQRAEKGRPSRQGPLHVQPKDVSFLPWMADFPMSRLSKHLLCHFPISDIASRRRNNYSYLVEKVSLVEGAEPMFPDLPDGVVPWVLPLALGQRPNLHKSMRSLGIPAVTWGAVRHPQISADEFPEADFLYEHLAFLPIHQDLQRPHLDLIAEAVKAVCRTGKPAPNPIHIHKITSEVGH